MDLKVAHLARKYAVAFFAVAGEKFDEHDYEYAGELQNFFLAHRATLNMLNFPLVSLSAQHAAIEKLASGFHTANLFNRLVLLLLRHRRIQALPIILSQIRELYCKRVHMIEFDIASSHELDDSSREVLLNVLARATGMRIRPTYEIDHSLIAGIRMQSDTLGWEHSVRKQLREIRYERA